MKKTQLDAVDRASRWSSASSLGVLLPGGGRIRRVAIAEKATSSVFLRMIKSLIVPLIFGTLVVGIAGHGDDMKRVGRLAFRSIVYFEVVTTLALAIGLVAVNMVKPGVGVSLAAATADKGAELAKTEVTLHERGRAHGAAELLRVRGDERGAAGRLLRDPLRRRARAGAGTGRSR